MRACGGEITAAIPASPCGEVAPQGRKGGWQPTYKRVVAAHPSPPAGGAPLKGSLKNFREVYD